MSSLAIHIELENDAFAGDDCGPEVARILSEMASRIKYTGRDGLEGLSADPRDFNGNCVGTCAFEIDDDEGEEEESQEESYHRRCEAGWVLRRVSRESLIKVLDLIRVGFSTEDETRKLALLVQVYMADSVFGTEQVRAILGMLDEGA